ncbi:sensor histidine kinase [Fervidobacterium thailandense]|uniref:Uncharacterized protein n=1 Tax=Fervidobacterium thailandense TaxID=1008305 RepID=A0A1E3G5A7_9BACT|nr:histidine kinase [Fervidobacterium thailandense]ODN30828.1 hypothetical protein A4H02_02870 [Fervidobacterium thailandense]
MRFILSLQIIGGLIFLYTAFIIPSNLYFAALLSIFMLVNTVGIAYYITRSVVIGGIGVGKPARKILLPAAVLIAGIVMLAFLIPRIYKLWSEIYSSELFVLFINTFAGVSALLVATFGFAYLSLKREFEEQLIKMQELENLRIKAELDALKSKVNPHFLFNALGSVTSMLELDAPKEDVINYLNSLAGLLRATVDAPSVWTLKAECETAEKYLKVQKFRFQDKLSYEILLPEEILNFKVPSLIIQPLVENAVVHNVGKVNRTVHVRVSCGKTENGVFISIEDNGCGMNGTRKGSGLTLVEERLKHFSKGARLYVESNPDVGTTVKVVIPYEQSTQVRHRGR